MLIVNFKRQADRKGRQRVIDIVLSKQLYLYKFAFIKGKTPSTLNLFYACRPEIATV
jgi:hypothetical protein